MSDAISPLAKQKLILALLAQSPDHARKHSQFRDCLHHIHHYISRLYSRTKTPETTHIRCALKTKCPKCMDPINVTAARRMDFRTILKTARKLGGGETGEHCKVWVLSGQLPHRLSGRDLGRILGRKDRGASPAMTGAWAGESVCGPFRAIVYSNSPKESAAFVFNSLVFGAPEAELDEERLTKMGIAVTRFHGKLGAAWQLYLERWATAQITQSMPEQIVEWMTRRGRQFEAIGALRGVRVREREEHLDKLHETMGESTRIGFFTRLEQADSVITRIALNLPLMASNLLNRPISSEEYERIMAMVKPQVRTALTPPIDPSELQDYAPMSPGELRQRLEELRVQQERMLQMLADKERDSTSNRVVGIPGKVM